MYHHYQYPVAKKEPQMFSTFLGLNDLHMKCFQEMYLDTYQALTACGTANFFPHISPTSVSTDSTSSNCMLSPLQLSPASASSYSSSSSSPGCGNMYTGLQQQKLLAVHQQHLTATAMAQHQLAMAAVKATGIPENTCRTATTSLQHHDEISKSLKMFAMLTANSNGHDFLNNKPASDQVIVRGGAQRSDDVRAVLKSVNVSQISEPTVSVPSSHLPQISSVDAVMQDFAGNGYIADELNRSQYGMHIKNTSNLAQNTATRGVNTTSLLTAAANQRQQLQQHNINLNFNNKFLKMFPAHLQQHSHGITTAAAATATAAANIEYNCNRKKLPKRYNGIKNDKYPSSKHCVFCENNHEPEAVVKSHSVRDSYGRVLCPKLRTYICPICGASGDEAHTVKYCPQKPIITMEDAIKAESFRLAKNAYYKPQMKV